MISRVLGLIRDMVFAALFGATAGADAFYVAFKIPNFLRRLFAEGAFSQAFVPVLAEYHTRRDADATRELIAAVSGTLATVLLGITVLAIAGAGVIALVFAPGFHDEPVKLQMVTDMLRLTFPYLLLISMTAFCGAVLNTWGYFAVPAFTPVLLNLALIGAALGLSPLLDPPVYALAWGVLAAGILQLAFQLPFMARIHALPRPRLNFRHEGVRQILRLMAPALFGVSVSQINLMLDTILASLLVTGSVSWLYYSDRLAELPLGVFGVALGTVVLPSLSKSWARAAPGEFSSALNWGIRLVLLVGLPAAVALVVLAEPLIAVIFMRGEMTAHDVTQAAQSLRGYALGLLAFMMIKVLAPGYYARKDTRTPVRIGVIAMVANMVFNLALIVPLAHAGLALATTLSAFLNAGLLWRGLRREGLVETDGKWQRWMAWLVISNGCLGAWLWLTRHLWQFGGNAYGLSGALNVLAVCVGGVLVYALALRVSGLRIRHLRPAGSKTAG